MGEVPPGMKTNAVIRANGSAAFDRSATGCCWGQAGDPNVSGWPPKGPGANWEPIRAAGVRASHQSKRTVCDKFPGWPPWGLGEPEQGCPISSPAPTENSGYSFFGSALSHLLATSVRGAQRGRGGPPKGVSQVNEGSAWRTKYEYEGHRQ